MKFALISFVIVSQLAFAEDTVKRPNRPLPIGGLSTIPAGSEVGVVADATHLRLTIVCQGTERPFWGMTTIRPPISSLWSAVPTISLVSEIGTAKEKRLTIVPYNLSERRHDYTFNANLKVPLLVGDTEVGFATLYSKDGEMNMHKVLYTLDRSFFSDLGDQFLLVSGNPLAKHMKIKAE